MKQMIAAAMLLAGTLSFASLAHSQDTLSSETVLATVNNENLTLGHVVAMRTRLPQQYQNLADDVLYKAILDQLIQQTALAAATTSDSSKRTKLSLENEMRAFLAAETMARLSEIEITAEDVETAFAEKYDSVIPENEYNASHILVETEDAAVDLLAQAQDGSDFAELAKEHSTGPSGASGGLLGWFGKGAMVPEFEQAVTELAVGEVSNPVKTQFGWHIVKLNDLRVLAMPTLEDVRTELVTNIQQTRLDTAVAALTQEANVVRFEVEVDPSIIRDVSVLAD